MQLFDNMMSAMIPMAQEFYLFVFFCLGFIVFRSEVLLGWLRTYTGASKSKKDDLQHEPIPFYSPDQMREDSEAGRFEAILEGWPLLENYTVEAFVLVVTALMHLDRPDDVGMFVAKTVANLPELRASLPEDPPVNQVNALATQVAYLHKDLDCKGKGNSFESASNVFRKDFHPYAGNLKSVRFCGQGIFFYFDVPDMQEKATLGHITRCGKNVPKDTESCECVNLPETAWKKVESFSINYC